METILSILIVEAVEATFIYFGNSHAYNLIFVFFNYLYSKWWHTYFNVSTPTHLHELHPCCDGIPKKWVIRSHLSQNIMDISQTFFSKIVRAHQALPLKTQLFFGRFRRQFKHYIDKGWRADSNGHLKHIHMICVNVNGTPKRRLHFLFFFCQQWYFTSNGILRS